MRPDNPGGIPKKQNRQRWPAGGKGNRFSQGNGSHLDNSSNSTKCTDIKGWCRVSCEHGAVYWRPLRCRKCRGCLAFKTCRITGTIINGMEGAEWTQMVTLTTTPGTKWVSIMLSWQAFIRWARMRWGRFEYAAVKQEGSNTGMKHLHVIMVGGAACQPREVSDYWKGLTGAWNIDVKEITGAEVAGYVSRYVAGGIAQVAKAVTFSRGWLRSGKPQETASPVIRRALDLSWCWVDETRSGVLVEYWSPEGECECPGRR